MAWTYILRCADGSYYVGSTVDMERRFAQHQAGEGAEYTKGRRPVALAWAAEQPSIQDAYRFEKQVQNWSRAKREALIRGDLADLRAKAKKDFSKRR